MSSEVTPLLLQIKGTTDVSKRLYSVHTSRDQKPCSLGFLDYSFHLLFLLNKYGRGPLLSGMCLCDTNVVQPNRVTEPTGFPSKCGLNMLVLENVYLWSPVPTQVNPAVPQGEYFPFNCLRSQDV